MERQKRSSPSLMPEFAIVTTLLLISAPVVLVGSAMWMAIKKRFAMRSTQ